ncbi:MAG: Crp/Fnr family transcriptional regulator [Rubrobacteraceae bacterium]|nr:Crp/Fnr family transcriptional regulator [Rubrobacteraceae bacterium]MCL6438177.1 Crp/Fnr family transcriptional regulator [Rubrobacteraceae bacterium]
MSFRGVVDMATSTSQVFSLLYQEKSKFLAATDLFRALPEGEIEELSWRLPEVRLERGQILYAPGQEGELHFLLREGKVRIYRVLCHRELTLEVVTPGVMFGEIGFCETPTHSSYAQVLEPSKLYIVKRGDLEYLIHKYPTVSVELINALSEKLRAREDKLVDLLFKSAPAKLASLLLCLAEEEGVTTRDGTVVIPFPYTHGQLAAMLGVNRETISRGFSILRRKGAVGNRRRGILLQDIRTLIEVARSG